MLCHYAECHYTECPILFIFMLNAIMLSIVMLNIIMLNVDMLNAVILSVIMLSVARLEFCHWRREREKCQKSLLFPLKNDLAFWSFPRSDSYLIEVNLGIG